jgi:hypothetical protein
MEVEMDAKKRISPPHARWIRGVGHMRKQAYKDAADHGMQRRWSLAAVGKRWVDLHIGGSRLLSGPEGDFARITHKQSTSTDNGHYHIDNRQTEQLPKRIELPPLCP